MALPKGVQLVRKQLRDGSEAIYYYWRATREKLPDPSSPDFLDAVKRARLAVSEAPKSGTFASLVIDYKRSPNFRDMEPSSRKAYDRALERLRGLGPIAVPDIKRRHVLELRDRLAAEKPQAANQLVMVMGVLMQFAVERELRETNPCARLKRLKGGNRRRWTDEEIEYATAHFEERFRRAIVLALFTGQREGDCLKMKWSQYDGTAVAVVPDKTKKSTAVELWIPAHKVLKKELDAWKAEATGDTILTNSYGKPWPVSSFGTMICRVMARHPRMAGLVFHGLRKAAAARLAEVGCSAHEIASITGHASLQMIELYTKSADQKKRARSAINRLELVSGPSVNSPKPRG
jgi:integrase